MYRNKVGGTIFGTGPSETWQNIKSNNLIRGLFTLFVIVIVILVVYLIYRAIQKNVTDKNLITCRSPPKGCLLDSGIHNLGKEFPPDKSKHPGIGSSDGSALPKSLSKNEFSINVWLYTPSSIWINPADKSPWYMILQGTSQAKGKYHESQPSVWLHPKTNRLLIRWTTVDNNIQPQPGNCSTKLKDCALPENYGKVFTDPVNGLYKCTDMCNTKDGTVESEQVYFKDTDSKAFTDMDPNQKDNTCPIDAGYDCCPAKEHGCPKNPKIANFPMQEVNQTCVQNLPLDRWFLLSIVVREQSSDVYIDGKIVKSVVFSSTIDANPDYIRLGDSKLNPFHAQWTQLRYYTSAISPYDVLKVYSWGPYPFDLSKAEKDWEQKFRNITGSVSYDSNYDDDDDTDLTGY